ncbi:PQQ-binding-like beta-propeller repeat protein, partial [Streptomyces sp. SID5785]|uniref:outer membrane protein assembly factor BamB family protein n=1 Tax=Streptomyces sp. SID5785 TaxID=2690309 RepID=UPI001361E861
AATGPGATTATASVPPSAPGPDTAPAAPAPAPLSRRGLLLRGGGIALGLAAAGAGVAYLTGGPERGPVRWSHELADVDVRNSDGPDLVVAGGRVHVGSGDYYRKPAAVHTFDLATGTRLWTHAFRQKWSRDTHFTVVGDTLLALTQHPDYPGGAVESMDAATGKRLWGNQSTESGEMRLDIHRPSGLLIHRSDNILAAKDARTGDSAWVNGDLAPTASSISWTVAGDLLLCSGGNAVHGRTGKVAWTRPDFSPLGDTAHTVGRTLLCYEKGTKEPVDLVGRSVDTGKVTWRSPFRSTKPDEFTVGAHQPLGELVSGASVLLPLPAGSRRRPTALNVHTGAPAWTYDRTYEEAGLADRASTGIPGGAFLLATADGPVCVDAADGAERWDAGGGSARPAGPYVQLTEMGTERLFQEWTRLRIVDARRGRTLWSGQFDGMTTRTPAASGKTAVVLDSGGTVYALRV